MQSIQSDALPMPEALKKGSSAQEGNVTWKSALKATMTFLMTTEGKLVALLTAAILFCFYPVLHQVPGYWFDPESYYTHGVLVPFLVGYILWERRETLKKTPIKGFWPAIIPLAGILYVVYVASRTEMTGPLTYLLIMSLFCAVLFIGGFKLTWAVAPAIIYLIFALPFGQGYIDKLTNPFQLYSTEGAFQLLDKLHLEPYRLDSTQILVGSYDLYVAGACSGLKLTLSVTAFMVLFMIIGHLRWYANIGLVVIILPLCILINSIRIALIGVVGSRYGEAAGASFHDWSGYISIVICFFILMRITRALGWK